MPRLTPSTRAILRDIGAGTIFASPILITVGIAGYAITTEVRRLRRLRALAYSRSYHRPIAESRLLCDEEMGHDVNAPR